MGKFARGHCQPPPSGEKPEEGPLHHPTSSPAWRPAMYSIPFPFKNPRCPQCVQAAGILHRGCFLRDFSRHLLLGQLLHVSILTSMDSTLIFAAFVEKSKLIHLQSYFHGLPAMGLVHPAQ